MGKTFAISVTIRADGEREQNAEIVLFAKICHFILPALLCKAANVPVADSLSATRLTDCSNPAPPNDDEQARKCLANPSRNFKFQVLRLSVPHTKKTMHERTGGTPIIVISASLAKPCAKERCVFPKAVGSIRDLQTPLCPWFRSGSAQRRSWLWQDCQW